MQKILLFLIVFLSCLSCTQDKASNTKVKNVILMIGDGMGPQQVSLLYYFAKYSKKGIIDLDDFAFQKIANQGHFGTSATEPHDGLVVDSACSATQLAIGKSSSSEMIGLDHQGNPVPTILQKAKKKGMRTGIVSNTRLTHATPASFAAHNANRAHEDEIALNMIELAPDVMLSGGASFFLPQNSSREFYPGFKAHSRRSDDLDLLELAKKKGHQLSFSKEEMQNSKGEKLLGLFTPSGMPNGIWYSQNKNNPKRTIPTLKEMSQTAVNKLSQNERGFFLMIEGGQIDWAGHANDAGTMLHEMLSFNETLNWVFEWVKKNPDTLLIVTADHETGSFGFGYHINDIPGPKKLTGSKFKERDFKVIYNYGPPAIVDLIYQQKMPLRELWENFSQLADVKQTPEKLAEMVEDVTGISISAQEAKDIMATTTNPHHHPDHKNLKAKEIPHIKDFASFYSAPANARSALIARKLADKQSVVWGTGGHTATPVHVYAYGPEHWAKRFSGYLDHPKLGSLMQEALGL